MGMKCWKQICRYDSSLLYFKLHFFLLHAGYSGVVPFMPIIAKHLGINATAIGIGFSVIPIFIFLSNPLFGCLVDYFQNIKVILILILLISVTAYFSILDIPEINLKDDLIYVRISLFNRSDTYSNIFEPLEKSCFEKLLDERIQCKLELKKSFSPHSKAENVFELIVPIYDSKTNPKDDIFEMANDKLWSTFHLGNIPLLEKIPDLPSLNSLHCSPNITQCLLKDKTPLVFSSYQYWLFMATTVIAATTLAAVMTLSSVGCYEKLGSNLQAYGRQRLFGTIGHGLLTTVAGILNDMEIAGGKPFRSGFYILAVFIALDILILCVMYIPKANMSSNMCKDLGKIFNSKEIVIYALGVAFVGVFNSIIAVYEFWYLEDLGASRTLLGLTVAMQCLAGEVPFLFFSGWFVDKLGHFSCLVAVFLAFAVRLISYSLIINPWLALPFDILHGVTFGLFHGAMTSFAVVKAPKGMEGTLLGIFGGLYDGLGYGVGSFVGGIGLDYLGSRETFFTASMISLGCCLITYTFKNRLLWTRQYHRPLQKSAHDSDEEKELYKRLI